MCIYIIYIERDRNVDRNDCRVGPVEGSNARGGGGAEVEGQAARSTSPIGWVEGLTHRCKSSRFRISCRLLPRKTAGQRPRSSRGCP